MSRPALLCAAIAALAACGCSAYRGVAAPSLITVRQITVNVYAATNAPSASPRSDSPPVQVLAPAVYGSLNLIITENPVTLNGGGSATSNDVSPTLQIPLK